jgi:hypothetical protein
MHIIETRMGTMSEKLKIPASNADERGSKRRLRSIKRDSAPGKPGEPLAAAAGQRKAVRGTRLRQGSR